MTEENPNICPRCQKMLFRNHDESYCMTHGTVYTPIRAWDRSPLGYDASKVPPPKRRKGPVRNGRSYSLTDKDRAILAAAE